MVVVVKRAALSQNLFDLQEAFWVKHVAKRKGASDVICGGFGFASAPKRKPLVFVWRRCGSTTTTKHGKCTNMTKMDNHYQGYGEMNRIANMPKGQ